VKKTDRRKRSDAPAPVPAAHRVPPTDPAHAVLAGILDVVRTSSWHFARIDRNGDLRGLSASLTERDRLDLVDELHRQHAVSPSGQRIAATLHRFAEAESGITLIFADARADYGIITLLRDATLGPFTSSEISMLTFALDAGSDRFSTLRLQPPAGQTETIGSVSPAAVSPGHHEEAFYVLDGELRIVLAWSSEQERRNALTGIREQVAERLPPLLEESVRKLTAAWATHSTKDPGMARPVSFPVLRTQPMSGPGGLFVGVRIDRFLPPNSLTGAATRFRISPREVQVLALLLDGEHLDQIADALHITSSTVQDHIKSMLDKTASRNRSELIARILGWESASGVTASM
jgi:DNA-binding CsgD family transcriptional regulator